MGEHGGARGQHLVLLHVAEGDDLLEVVAQLVQHLERGHLRGVDLALRGDFVHEGGGLQDRGEGLVQGARLINFH